MNLETLIVMSSELANATGNLTGIKAFNKVGKGIRSWADGGTKFDNDLKPKSIKNLKMKVVKIKLNK